MRQWVPTNYLFSIMSGPESNTLAARVETGDKSIADTVSELGQKRVFRSEETRQADMTAYYKWLTENGIPAKWIDEEEASISVHLEIGGRKGALRLKLGESVTIHTSATNQDASEHMLLEEVRASDTIKAAEELGLIENQDYMIGKGKMQAKFDGLWELTPIKGD